MSVEFVERLPERGGFHAKAEYDEIADALRLTPRRWARVATSGDPKAIPRVAAALKSRGCDVARRTVGGELALYARFRTKR